VEEHIEGIYAQYKLDKAPASDYLYNVSVVS
jgi:hypothetical protein